MRRARLLYDSLPPDLRELYDRGKRRRRMAALARERGQRYVDTRVARLDCNPVSPPELGIPPVGSVSVPITAAHASTVSLNGFAATATRSCGHGATSLFDETVEDHLAVLTEVSEFSDEFAQYDTDDAFL